jgi:hypothetical protein
LDLFHLGIVFLLSALAQGFDDQRYRSACGQGDMNAAERGGLVLPEFAVGNCILRVRVVEGHVIWPEN